MLDKWQERLEAAVLSNGRTDDGSHDLGHCRRVWRMSQQIADETGAPVDMLVLLAAAYLHDIVAFDKSDRRRAQASRLAAEKARDILTRLGFPAEKLDTVAHAIEAHSFYAQIPPRTIEAEILQDADRMEALGAIGLARLFHVGGRIGAKLFHEDDPLAQDRQRDDTAYSLDHFYAKILLLPDRMNTEPGRKLARQRVRIIEQFLECLLAEIGCTSAPRSGEKRA